ncbi:MAG TPA: adenylate/guanylate cyclase domain-containing protein [Mycobacterium sp.]|nr:adenylate/guanylate cyclase domain-containing protein [Mycobacterium sp.]
MGRSSELIEVQEALKAHRLVTLTGVGGVGKARLALEVAALSADGFADGVWVIELAPVGAPESVPDAVAAVLGVTQQQGMTLADSLAAALEGRSRLLVFDNCEHVLDAAADLIEVILGRSSTVRVLATSREGLRVSDEQLWPVPSLAIGLNSAATTLFLDRAHAVAPHVSLADACDEHAVAEIGRRLDGIPLAIELAASRMQSMTVIEVRDRLDDRFRLLVGSRRGLERHQTLRHAVQWSYDLLDDAEATLLVRCSVFAGGFDIDGAGAVADSDDEYATLDLLDALVRKSLLVADQSAHRTRYSMLETIRQFAEEQLAASGRADDVRASHAHYFAEFEAEVLALWDGPRQRMAYAWLDLELANLRAAFRWAADHDDLDAAASVAHFAGFVGFWGEQHEPIRWAEELIEPAAAVQHRRLAQLYALATLCFAAGRIDDSIRYAEAGQAAVRSGRFDDVRKESEAAVGSCYAMTGEAGRWVEWCRDVIARRPETYVHAQAILALALKMAGADDEATAATEELLAVADTIDNPNLAAWALFAYGTTHREVAPAAAYDALRRGLTIAQDSGSGQTASSIASMLSPLAITNGEPPAAVVCGFAVNPFTQSSLPEIVSTVAHLRELLGDSSYESLARTGQNMTTAVMVRYTYEQIDRIRAEL